MLFVAFLLWCRIGNTIELSASHVLCWNFQRRLILAAATTTTKQNEAFDLKFNRQSGSGYAALEVVLGMWPRD